MIKEDFKPQSYWENAPGHSHDVVGIWDADNGEMAGKTCLLCFRWNEYERLESELKMYREKNFLKTNMISTIIDEKVKKFKKDIGRLLDETLKFYERGNFRDGPCFTTVELMELQKDNGLKAKKAREELKKWIES